MELTKDMFKAGLDIPLMLESAKQIIKYNGHCGFHGACVPCSMCPMHCTKLAKGFCLVAKNTNVVLPLHSVFKAEALNLSRQFIALFDVPKTHHINFMEE